MKSSPSIADLVFKRGGVGGAVRRIIYRRKGSFTATQIRAALYSKHPALQPAPGQVENILDHMERRRIVITISKDWTGKSFHRLPRQPRRQKFSQQRFSFWSKR